MKVAIIGRSEWTYLTMKRLVEAGYEVPFVVTAKASPEYRYTASDFEHFAKENEAAYLYNPKVQAADLKLLMSQSGEADIAVSINYSGVISQEVIDLFPLGILNAHGGDLPRYRGNACQAWAIINKEKRSGLCIHKMIGGELDSGPILKREYFELSLDTRISQIYQWMDERIPEMMLEAIAALEKDPNYVLEYQSQDPQDALRCYPRKPEDGEINWKMTATDIVRLVNASSEPYAGAFCLLENEACRIWKAEFHQDKENYLGIPGQVASFTPQGDAIVLAGDGKVCITEMELKGERGKPSSFIKSLRTRFK